MKLIQFRLCMVILSLLLPAARLRAGAETREQVGSLRFALRDLPPLLQPVQGTRAYLVNGRNANWYDDKPLASGTIRVEINYLHGAGPGSASVGMTTYHVIQVTGAPSGNPPTRRHSCHLEGDRYRINVYFASGDPGRKPGKEDLRKALGRHIVLAGEEKS